MISLAAPVFAALLPLALLPVLFHLFFRIRKQPRTFPSLLFFQAADPRLSSRRRLREWLVLLLRTLALAALILALARPVRQGWGGRDAHVTVVIDNSASMAAADGDGQTRLSRALAAATAVLQDGSVRQGAVVSTVRDPAVPLPAGFSDDLAGVRAALGAIRDSHGSGDAAGALRQAAALSRGVLQGAVEVHLFTDLQATEWGTAASPVAFARGTAVVVHDVGRGSDRAGVVALLPPTARPRRLVAGRTWRFDAHLRNYGTREAEATVNLALGDTRLRQAATVGAGQTREVRLPLPALPPGEHRVRVWLDGPSAAPSAEAWQVVRVSPPDDVWLVGDARDSGLLGLALAPAADGLLTGLRVKAVPDLLQLPRSAGADAPATGIAGSSPPVLVVVSFRQLADRAVAASCRDFAARGGTLLVCPESARDGAAKPALPDWCGVDAGAGKASEKGEPVVVLAADAALWDDVRDERGHVSLRGVQLRRWLPLTARLREGATAMAGTTDGAAVLTRTVLGRGLVYVSGFAWDLHWSNLPRRAVFLPLALGFARPAQPDEPAARVIQAGAPLDAERRLTAAGAGVRLRTVAGDAVAWSGRADALATPARAGVYRVEGLPQPLTLAVAGSPGEAAPARVPARGLAVLAGSDYRTLTCRSASESAGEVQRARHGQSLFGLFLALAACFWLLELWLVNQRPAAAGKV
ncbi:MAG: VWA domain-containing protein [bacterium]